MLAPVTGNHPRPVFQSVSLLFNYPFKAYNLVGHDGARMPRAGNDTRGKSGREIWGMGGGEGASVGVKRGIRAPIDRLCIGVGTSVSVHRDKDGRQLCCETSSGF